MKLDNYKRAELRHICIIGFCSICGGNVLMMSFKDSSGMPSVEVACSRCEAEPEQEFREIKMKPKAKP